MWGEKVKVRNGFVTNSSSSSFVVTFDKIPENVGELQQLLFGDKEAFGVYDRAFTTETLAKQVFNDLMSQSANDWESIFNEFDCNSEYFNGSIDVWDTCREFVNDREKYSKCLNSCHTYNEKVVNDEFDKFRTNNSNKFTFVFEYGDDTDLGCVLEHGEVFRNLKYIRVNKH